MKEIDPGVAAHIESCEPAVRERLLAIRAVVLSVVPDAAETIKYGIPTFVSTNCPTVTAADTTTQYRVAGLFHRDCMAVGVQMNVRFQTQYKLEYLANLMVADQLYGVKALRTDDSDVTGSNYRKSHAILLYTK